MPSSAPNPPLFPYTTLFRSSSAAETTRQRFTRKVAGNNLCIGCHQMFSDIGYALESYDALGRFRETEKVFDEKTGMLLGELPRSEEHTSELQSPCNLVCRLLLRTRHSFPTRRSSDLPAPRRPPASASPGRWRATTCASAATRCSATSATRWSRTTPSGASVRRRRCSTRRPGCCWASCPDRKSTRLNSSHLVISYAVFCSEPATLSLHDALPIFQRRGDHPPALHQEGGGQQPVHRLPPDVQRHRLRAGVVRRPRALP